MKESLRRPILFAVIVITGSLLILFDIPLIVLLPIVLIVGFIILLILGAVTITEIKTAFGTLKPANLKKIGIIKKLNDMKFFEKSAPKVKEKPQPVKAEAKPSTKEKGKKGGIRLHFTSFMSSLKSLKSLFKERNKRVNKVEDINKQLDKTVSEKVEKNTATVRAGNVVNTSAGAPPRGAGTNTPPISDEQDPFLSLSEDEFDAGLLDSLDDDNFPVSMPGMAEDPDLLTPDTPSPDISGQSLDLEGEVGNILADNASGLDEFEGLDSVDAMDSDLADLDSLSLDDVDFDDETGDESPQVSKSPPVSEVILPEPDNPQVKTEWVKSDAPKNASQFEDQVSTQADMAAFAGGGGGDADLLSSLASDVKHVKVEKNLSLLRELKDFKAPATEIEGELNGMYARMDSVKKTQKK
jgi:hypothetical protein